MHTATFATDTGVVLCGTLGKGGLRGCGLHGVARQLVRGC
jgi:hypothetical protein